MHEHIDWDKLWRESLLSSSWMRRRGSVNAAFFWDSRAQQYYQGIKRRKQATAMLVHRIAEKLNLSQRDTILEIGPGPGTFTIPFSKMVKHITVVEPSKGMIEALRRYMAEEGVSNITVINKHWEEILPHVDVDVHDVVFAAHSLVMLDLKDAVKKMNSLARRFVCAIMFAHRPQGNIYRKLWPLLHGEEYRPSPTYIYLYNLLYQMGICANVEIIERTVFEHYPSLEKAVEEWLKWLQAENPSQEAIDTLKSELLKTAKFTMQGVVLARKFLEAVVWWKPR